MKISVIIPTYNPGFYIKDCLESLYAQTLDNRSFEVLIVLNGDKDPYFEDLEKHIHKRANYKLLYTSEKGVSNARNIGIINSKGEYLCFIDDDDMVSSNYLEGLLYKISNKNNSIIVSNVYTFVHSIEEQNEDYITKAFFKESGSEIFNNRKFLSSACCKLIPRNVISDHRFNVNLNKNEDALFMFILSSNIKNIIKSDSCVIYYRRMRTSSASRLKRSYLERLNIAISTIKEYNRTYFSKINNYDTRLYISRVIATIINL